MWKRRDEELDALEHKLAAMGGTWYTEHGDVWRPGGRTWRQYWRWFFFG